MAATDKTHRNQKTLDMVFAVSCILMLLSVVWMLVADYNREFKSVQRTFRDVESVLDERQMLAQLPDPSAVADAQKLVADRRKARDEEKEKVKARDQELTAERDKAVAHYREVKADFDSKSSFYNIDIEERDQPGISQAVRRERTERVEARKKELDQLQHELDDAQKAVDKADADYKHDVTDPVARAENDLSDAEDALKKLTGNFDRFAKLTVQKQWGLGDAFRALPILDAFESPTKIKQIVLSDLPIEYGSFKYVTRYDRCTSCHTAIERPGFDHRALTKLTRGQEDAWQSRGKAVHSASNDILAAVGAGMPDEDRKKLLAVSAEVDKRFDAVTRVEASAPGAPAPAVGFGNKTSGKATKVAKDALTVQGDDNREQTFKVPADARVVIDGVEDKLENVTEGSTVVVTVGDDIDPFKAISDVLRDLRDPGASQPEVVAAAKDPTLDADLVQVRDMNDDYREAESLPRKLELARRIVQGRKDKGENLGYEPGDLPSHARTVSLSPGQVTQFATHPRLDLFVDSNSPHPMEKFGCTVCHAGQGSATDFLLSAHTPADARQREQWDESYHWRASHDWEFPMLSSRFVESSCLKCHHEVTDLVREGNKEEAPKLLRGYNLVRENGCFGCHEIAGIKSGREVGPDLRLEPAPALDWLTPADQDRAKADPTNPPGAFRKVGPSLRRIAEKTNEGWARRWIQSPRGFRPDTKMPHFYNLANNAPDGLPDEQKEFPAAEIYSISHYLFAESAGCVDGKDTYRVALEEGLKSLQGKLQYSPLDEKERKELADVTHKLADLGLLSAPSQSARINAAADDLRAAQDALLERYAKRAELEENVSELEKKAAAELEADLHDGEDESLKRDLDARADECLELAKKYAQGLAPEDVRKLTEAKAAREKAFQALLDMGEPRLQKWHVDQAQKPVDDAQKKVDELQDKVKKAPDDRDAKKDLDQAKKDLDAAKKELDRAKNDVKALDAAKGDVQKAQEELTGVVAAMDQAAKDLDPLAAELEVAGRAVPIEKQITNAEGEPVQPDSLPAPDKGRLGEGRRVFTERGCLACHVHDGVREKGTDPNDPPPVPDAAATFAPDLSRLAAKIAPTVGGPDARRRWVVQWVLNPNVHHPRTRMPITHLTVRQACDVADWLLSQEVKPEQLADWPADPEKPTPVTLVKLARVYLAKAPGVTSAKLDQILPADAAGLDNVHGYSDPADVQSMARDADERILAGPITEDKLERYIGKKSIGRLGCYGCHDVPGFETAKPVGTALNDWGKKDPARLAFEDADAFVRDHYNVVESRDAADNKTKADPDWKAKDGKEPYERTFYDALEHQTREGFLHQKLTEPRSYDYHRIRAWDDRLRMPQFRFARSRRRAGESDEAYAIRQEREEAEAREAVMTFILGLVAEPIPEKYVNTPNPDRLAEVKGRKVLDKYNCIGCHQVRSGVFEVKPSKDTLDALERAYEDYATSDAAKKDHVFPGHNAWTGLPSPWPDRLVIHGTQPRMLGDEDAKREFLNLRLTEALRFTNNDRVVRDLPAGGNAAKLLPEDLISASPPYGGALADLLVPYLAQANSTDFGKEPDARSVLPPPLVREGERVQPKWLYSFLLDPGTVRPQERMRLRMPKFNMSPEEAMTLVNYFGAADKLGNPGAGITYPYLTVPQTDDKYWRDRTEEYLKRLDAAAGPDGKGLVQRAKDLLADWQTAAAKRLDAAKATAASAAGDDKTRAEAEVAALQASLDRWAYEMKQPDAFWDQASKQADDLRKLADLRDALKTAQGDDKTKKEAEAKDVQAGIDKANDDLKKAYIDDLTKRFEAAQQAVKDAKDEEKPAKDATAKALAAVLDQAKTANGDNDAADLLAEWKKGSPDAYRADAYRLAANANICMSCHNIGPLRIQGAKGPDLSLAAERLRPQWTFEWIANPERMFAYSPAMPQNFPNGQENYKPYLAGDPRDQVRAVRDVLMDLPRLENLPANRATRAAITGDK